MFSLLSFLLLIPATLSLSPPVVQIRHSPITLPFAVRINATGTAKIIEADRARARHFFQVAQETLAKLGKEVVNPNPNAVIGVPVTNTAVAYTVSVGVGNPPTQYTLLVDTGSSNTWIGATTPYVRTSTSVQTADSVSVTYGSGSFSGTEFIDRVTLGPGLVVNQQSIGVASTSVGFTGVDGILGLGPIDLTLGTLNPSTNSTIPTLPDNLIGQGTISLDQFGISFEPTTTASVTNGEITFGGVDTTKFTGGITFMPRTLTSPSSLFWGIEQSIRYGPSTNILSTTAGIVDTGTTLVLIATDAFQRYQAASGGIVDTATGLLRLTPAQFVNLKSLFFVTGGTTFELTANAQAWPHALNTLIGGNTNSVYLIVGDIGTPSGSGLDFIDGFAFLERFYSVYDNTNNRVGLATTPFTHATSN